MDVTRRMGVALLALAVAGCESLPQGTFDDFGKSVLGGVMGTAAASASIEMAQKAAEQMCSSGNATCRNLTMVTVTGFTESFIDRLTQSDVRKMDEARRISIQTGKTEEWKNPETGASGTVTSVPAEPKPPEPTPVKVQKDRLESLPVMVAIGEPFVVANAGGANVRGGPGTAYEIVDKLARNERIKAIGKVRDDDWYLVGRGEVGIGYVFGELIEPWVAPPDATLDEALAEEPAPAAPAQEVDEVQVQMASQCFTTTQRVTLANGKSEEATVTSCRTPDGWVQV